MLRKMHPSLSEKYYSKLIPGLDYELLQSKEKYFTEFKVIGGLRFFKYFHNEDLVEEDGFGDIEFFSNGRKTDALVCKTDCVLASVNKNSFNMINKKIQ